jgi:hypothetical protein
VFGQLGHYSKRFLPKRFGKEKTNVPTLSSHKKMLPT